MNLNTPDPVQLSVHRHGTCGAVWRLDVGDAGVGRAAWCPDRAARRIAGGGPWQAPLSTLGPALDRLRKLPDWLWLAPREDAFVASADPARRAELLLMMRHLLGRDVDVALTTRGGLREGRELVALAAAAPGRVAVRVGLFTRDLALEARWEDGLAPASQRIALASALVDAGAAVTLELGPIIPFVNDAPRALDGVMRAAARAHVRHVAPRWIEDAPGLLLQVEREVGRSSARMLSGSPPTPAPADASTSTRRRVTTGSPWSSAAASITARARPARWPRAGWCARSSISSCRPDRGSRGRAASRRNGASCGGNDPITKK